MMARFGNVPFGTNGTSDAVFHGRLNTPRLAFLWDHEVMGRALLAGAAMLEAALAAAGAITAMDEGLSSKLALTSASIMAPYVLPKSGTLDISCRLNPR